jgi:ribonuclease BN (tRNA processing enzyme)
MCARINPRVLAEFAAIGVSPNTDVMLHEGADARAKTRREQRKQCSARRAHTTCTQAARIVSAAPRM